VRDFGDEHDPLTVAGIPIFDDTGHFYLWDSRGGYRFVGRLVVDGSKDAMPGGKGYLEIGDFPATEG